MGKAGARELNYVSDVDVIFVAEGAPDSDIALDRMIPAATRLAMLTMQGVHEIAVEPPLWEVDANLRPEGKDGALVRTLESHIAYYDRWAKDWEFQALLKARPLAGDRELGERYVEALAPKVWSSASRPNFVEQVQRMRERVTDFIPADEREVQLKLGPGGLRDIEFTVQLLQLVHGQTDPSVRERGTLRALDALAAAGYIGRTESAEFAEDYRVLRLLEHRLQLEQLSRTHLMPRDEERLRVLARATRLGSSAKELTARWQRTKLQVRSLHERLFYRPLLSAVARLPEQSLQLTSAQAQARLKAIGFVDPHGALAHIAALTQGVSRRATMQRTLLPVLLEWFAAGSNPGRGPARLPPDQRVPGRDRLVPPDAERLPGGRVPADPGARGVALRGRADGALPRGDPLARGRRAAPTAQLGRAPRGDARHRGAACRPRLRSRRAAHRPPPGVPAARAGRHPRHHRGSRSSDRRCPVSRAPSSPGCCAASDGTRGRGRSSRSSPWADMGERSSASAPTRTSSTCTDPSPAWRPSSRNRRAEFIVSEFTRLTEDHRLPLDLDIGLRPEGKNGAVVRSLRSYEAYYQRWSLTWEAQALLRARGVVGDHGLVQDFTALADRVRYPRKISENDVREVKRIKARVENERLPHGADPARHLKLGRGTLSDVEWLVQLLQLQHGARVKGLRTPSTLAALAAAESARLLKKSDAAALRDAWILASRLRSAITLSNNRTSDILPSEVTQLDGIARLLEYPPGSAALLEEHYLRVTRRARTVFERLFYGEVERLREPTF